MVGVRFNVKNFTDTMLSSVGYTRGFIQEVKRSEPKIAQKVADLSIDVFYEYLDGLARSHPGMLHHVYEWGQVGDPFARLYELRLLMSSNTGTISVDFLSSDSTPPNSDSIFYDKATIMEEGIPVVINEKDAQALFFEIDGEEFFRKGPIFIANPGGSATRGSFLKAFNEFYTIYFNQVYLQSIGFYKHFSNPNEYIKNFKSAIKSKNGAAKYGSTAALSWIQKSPGVNI